MKRKISSALAASLIVSQMQGLTFAESTNNVQDVDITKNISQYEDTTKDTNDENKNVTEQSQDNTEDIELDKELTSVSEDSVVDESVVSDEDVKNYDNSSSSNYQVKGKLELDLNFYMPIKYVAAEQTNIEVTLKDENNKKQTIKLGSDISSNTIDSGIKYTLEALNSKREALADGEKDLSFYHLTFENLELGTYSIEISGDGYESAIIDNIDISNYSKRVLVGTSDNEIVIDDKGTEDKLDDEKEYYPGVFLAGNVNTDHSVNYSDYEDLKNHIKTSESSKVDTNNKKYDLNRDGKIDITDLTYVHKNIDKQVKNVEILDTDAIIDPNNVNVSLPDTTKIDENVDIKDILKDNGSTVSFKTSSDAQISESNPISVSLDLAGQTRSNKTTETLVIKAPSENAPSAGTIVIPGAGENGKDLEVKFSEKNVKQSSTSTLSSSSQEEIVIDLGKQVAVSQITINITGSRSNKNLAEIAKVEFLNNVYKEIPKPKMNIPVINNFKSTTQVGQESMTIGWDHETNVTGYEIKVQEVDEKGNVKSTSTYKTSENTLRIEKIEGYSTYRFSIQSLSGDWKSGYKDEQEDYKSDAVGATNLLNNSNDKDGKPDNVDTNYNPQAWNSNTGILEDKAAGENGNKFGSDSIVELQVIPETAPEGPEGITVKSEYKSLTVSWKSHKKAKDYDLYYRKVGTGAWIKANDPNDPKYVDSDTTNNIPDGVANLTPEQKTDKDELIRGTSYTIKGLEDEATYEIKMTATNHHGTGGLSQTYVGKTATLTPPKTTNYKLINTANGVNEITSHITNVEYKLGNYSDNIDDIVDNDYSTSWVHWDWDTAIYGKTGPVVTFDKEYTIDTIRVIKALDTDTNIYYSNIGYLNKETGKWEYVDATVTKSDSNKVATLKLSKPITAEKVQVNLSSYTRVIGISEIKFYHYDSLEDDVDSLFKDDLMLELSDDVTQEKIDELVKRANTIDPVNMEYHPNQTQILSNLERAQDLFNDINLNDNIKVIDPTISNYWSSQKIGQSNDWQALGIAVKPGDKVTIYIGSDRADKLTEFDLAITQHYGESGTAYQVYDQKLKIGKNEIVIPESGFDMDYEKGGNLYIRFGNAKFDGKNNFQVRVSGGTEIPHLNLNNIISDDSKESQAKEAIRTYIRQLKTYVNTLPDRYPTEVSAEDKIDNIYKYDSETSILNSTDIEGDRITLSLAADQVLKGIQSGLSTEDQQVDRLYETLRAWEQLMQISYSQQGLLEEAIDFDGDGKITDNALEQLGGKSENTFFKENKAPTNRLNVKYQRMFTGAFMYASSHHVGVGYGSVAGLMQGVPFKFDASGNLVNKDEGELFGWGISHEIGHVHDASGLTYAEVTNNILALVTQTFNGEDKSRLEGSYDEVYKKVTSGSIGLASGSTRLAMFWQLHLAYDQNNNYEMLDVNSDKDITNDTFYAKLYRVTREKGSAPAESGYDQTAQTFIIRSSDAVGKDLREFFLKWGIEASPKTNAYLDSKNYPKEDKAIYYLNDNAKRIILNAKNNNNESSLVMANDTKVNASFGVDKDGKQITDKTYLNQKEVPLKLSVTKDSDKVLGYEIIKVESTSNGIKEEVCGFIERNANGDVTEYTDVIDAVNNRTFGYKVRAYDYDLNVTEETVIGTVKVSHDGSLAKSDWTFDTNTRSPEDVADENTGHGQVQNGSINKIKDNDKSTVYNASKATNNSGQTVGGDPYVTIEMSRAKSVVGLKYTPGNTTSTKKFSLRNLFKRSTEVTYSPIESYEVYVSQDGTSWTKAHSGKFDTTKENTIYFNEKGNSDNSQLWSYNAKYVKLVAKGASTISIAELDILGPQGDNIEIGVDNNDQNYKNGVGILKSDYEYADGKFIPAGSILVIGEYKGDPAFNAPLVINENGDNFALQAQAILLANLPEDAELGEVAEGNWIYWITPEQQKVSGNIEGTKIKAELYRFNKIDSNGSPVGQRLVSDSFLVDLPENLKDLPSIDLSSSKTRALSNSYDQVIEINSQMIKTVSKNR